jgi:hypothetical protein
MAKRKGGPVVRGPKKGLLATTARETPAKKPSAKKGK